MSRALLRGGRWSLVWLGACLLAADVCAAAPAPPVAGAGSASASAAAGTTATPAKKAATVSRATSRARARAREAAEAKVPKFKLDPDGELVPALRAAAAIIYSPESGQILWEEHAQDQRSIASITKVMTAIVTLENAPDLFETVTIQRSDVRGAALTALRANDRVTIWNLLHLLLIPSDNAAARALARVSPLGYDGFIARMNEKAQEFGLERTSYADPSGLLADNVSCAFDMARLISYAAQDPRIGPIMRTPEFSFATASARPRTIRVRSSNQLVRQGDVDVLGGKTGFIQKAGYCLASLLRVSGDGPTLAVVVLGARSNAGRFMETRHLLNWVSARTQIFNLTSQD